MKPQIFVLLILSGLTGCLTTRADLRADQAERSQSPREIAEVAPVASTGATEAAAPAKPAPPPTVATRFEEYDEQIRMLNGRLDVVENMTGQINTTLTSDKQMLATEKLKLEDKFAAFEDALKKLSAQVQALSDDVAKLKAPIAPPPAPKGGRADFDEGESLFAAKKFKESIVSYQQYRDGNPNGQRYAEATLKIGMAFQELGLKDESRAFYDEVTAKFPTRAEAKKARQRLKTLK